MGLDQRPAVDDAEEVDPDDWILMNSPVLDSTHADLAAFFDSQETEQSESRFLDREKCSLSPGSSGWSLEPAQPQLQDASGPEGEEDGSLDPGDLSSTPDPNACQVRRHENTQRKLTDWDLVVQKKCIIMGDSNLSRMPSFVNKDLQVDSFPGAHFRHAQALMEKTRAPNDLMVETVILSFGINSRANKCKETTVKNLQGAIRSTRKKFPFARIWVPLVNFSTELPEEEQENLRTLNQHMIRNVQHIPLLPADQFATELDDVHWTADTARAMFTHWLDFLNSAAL